MDERAVSTVGTVLVLGIVASLAVAATLLAARIPDAIEQDDVADRDGAARVRDGHHEVTLAHGESIPSSGRLLVTIDGNQSFLSLDAWPIGDSWDVGEWLCIVGPGPECAFAQGDAVAISAWSDDRLAFQLSTLSDAGLSDDDLVQYQGRRPSFRIDDDGGINVQCDVEATMHIVGTQITHGIGGSIIPVYARPSSTGTAPFLDVFGAPVTAGMQHPFGLLPEGSVLGVWGHALSGSFDESYSSFASDPHVLVLQDGDQGPAFQPYGQQIGIGQMLEPYVDDDGIITLQPEEAIVLFEFNPSLNSPAADFQDLVVLFEFAQADCP